ncbi:HTH-type transcriptional regulator TreR [Shewanella sp. VB17]|uniref:trehalose operon repressor TreR n=1 Tax=Shewanella sp. VB17 TaxID=2739432 RepID=UPI0015650297|nr:trehalose operon repressor TreR [Shewanella sp. VB17]NRD75230.1 HTH-type transcriptional regulator TreR [Shewanella sp. VB17]
MAQNLTILDIARMCGVGKSTVSRVINQDPKVKPDTRDKVQAFIDEVGFVPSRSAKAMRTKRSMVIGVILTRLDSASENKVIRGILNILTQHGYDTLLMESQMTTEGVEHCLNTLKQRGVDGVLLFGFCGITSFELKNWQHNLVLLAWPTDGFSSVCYDDARAIELSCQHLYDLGKRHIAFIGVDDKDETTGLRRTRAYLDFCQKHQLTPRFATGELNYHSAFDNTAHILESTTQAIICASDTLALGSAYYVQSQARSEVIICGVGHSELLKFLFPNTISVELGYEQAGIQAARLLLEHLHQQQTPKQKICQCSLIQ